MGNCQANCDSVPGAEGGGQSWRGEPSRGNRGGQGKVGSDAVSIAEVPRGGSVPGCQYCCGNWVGFPAFYTFLSFSIKEVKIRRGARVAQGVLHQWDRFHPRKCWQASGMGEGGSLRDHCCSNWAAPGTWCGQRQGSWGRGTSPLLGCLPPPTPPAGAHWRQQHPGPLAMRPMAASRSVLGTRDFGAGNGSSQTGCQGCWETGRGSHMG